MKYWKKQKKEREIDKNQIIKQQLNVGDKVRISFLSLLPQVRKLYKEGNQKNVILRFTPDIYTIDKVIKSRSKFSEDQYQVKDLNGYKLPLKFYYNELLKVPNHSKNLPNNLISKLNLR